MRRIGSNGQTNGPIPSINNSSSLTVRSSSVPSVPLLCSSLTKATYGEELYHARLVAVAMPRVN